MSSTMVDAIVIVILILSTVFAWSRGLAREALSLLGWVLAIFLAREFAYLLVPFISDLPYVSEYVDSCEILTLISFVVLFLILMVVVALVTPFFSDMISNSRIGLINSALGGFFGFLRGLLIVFMIFVIYDTFIAASMAYEGVDNARTYGMFQGPRSSLQDSLPSQDDVPNFLSNQFDALTRRCPVNS